MKIFLFFIFSFLLIFPTDSYSQVIWNQVSQQIDGVQNGGYTGCAVSLSGDGTRAAFGSHSNSNNGHETGRLQIYDLTKNAKGIYFLEIEMDDGVINKKLILQ